MLGRKLAPVPSNQTHCSLHPLKPALVDSPTQDLRVEGGPKSSLKSHSWTVSSRIYAKGLLPSILSLGPAQNTPGILTGSTEVLPRESLRGPTRRLLSFQRDPQEVRDAVEVQVSPGSGPQAEGGAHPVLRIERPLCIMEQA